MTCQFVIDWKSIVALGFVTVGIIFAIKMNSEQAKEVSIHAIDACKDARLCKKMG